MPKTARHPLPLRLALLAAFVLVVGLPRLLVLCTHADGEASLEWAHLEGSCCHDGSHDVDADPHGEPANAPGGGCEHDSLAVDVAPPPGKGAGSDGKLPLAFDVPRFVLPAPPSTGVLPSPPATGPPRTDQRSELRSTSLLLL